MRAASAYTDGGASAAADADARTATSAAEAVPSGADDDAAGPQASCTADAAVDEQLEVQLLSLHRCAPVVTGSIVTRFASPRPHCDLQHCDWRGV